MVYKDLYGIHTSYATSHANLFKKIVSGIRELKRVRSFVPHETLQSIFMSLLQPHFDYCNSVWGCCGKTLAKKLQNCAARILTSSNYDANTDNLILKLGWIKLDSQLTIHKAVWFISHLMVLLPITSVLNLLAIVASPITP